MAVYFTLAIDCDQDKQSAAQWAEFYDGHLVPTKRFGELSCKSWHTLPQRHWATSSSTSVPQEKLDPCAGDWHKVCVHPAGMMMPQKPTPGILNVENMNLVRRELYDVLNRGISEGFEFRSAYFGWEAQDVLGETDWLERLDEMNQSGKLPQSMMGLILKDQCVQNDTVRKQLKDFALGYLWWDKPSTGH